MTRANKLVIAQGVGITLQIINAQIATVIHNATIALIVGAIVAGYQFIIQKMGNETEPVKREPVESLPVTENKLVPTDRQTGVSEAKD